MAAGENQENGEALAHTWKTDALAKSDSRGDLRDMTYTHVSANHTLFGSA